MCTGGKQEVVSLLAMNSTILSEKLILGPLPMWDLILSQMVQREVIKGFIVNSFSNTILLYIIKVVPWIVKYIDGTNQNYKHFASSVLKI